MGSRGYGGVKAAYIFSEGGYTAHGEMVPGVPIVNLALKVGRRRARGPAIFDTGFDGGVTKYGDYKTLQGYRTSPGG
ncbi:MAG: hypothetical protein ACTSRV_14535 [Candidatus Freyarchaeota archaeon]